MANEYYQVTKEINGKKYTAQFSGISTAVRAVDETYIEGSSNNSIEKLAKYVFKYVLVDPAGMTIDDFEDTDTFNKVVGFCRDVMQGNFRETTNESPNKAKSKG